MAKAKKSKVATTPTKKSAVAAKKASPAKKGSKSPKPAAKASAKPAKKGSKSPKPAKKGSKTGPRPMQIDFGWFLMKQDSEPVGQVVVVDNGNYSGEYFYLCTSPKGGYQTYVWPSATNSPVSIEFEYLGSEPEDFDPNEPSEYANYVPFSPNVQFIGCDCAS